MTNESQIDDAIDFISTKTNKDSYGQIEIRKQISRDDERTHYVEIRGTEGGSDLRTNRPCWHRTSTRSWDSFWFGSNKETNTDMGSTLCPGRTCVLCKRSLCNFGFSFNVMEH